jgi:hypothetical protein
MQEKIFISIVESSIVYPQKFRISTSIRRDTCFSGNDVIEANRDRALRRA